MKMNRAALADYAVWEKAKVLLPAYDVEAMVQRTKENPIWVHFGAGNISAALLLRFSRSCSMRALPTAVLSLPTHSTMKSSRRFMIRLIV